MRGRARVCGHPEQHRRHEFADGSVIETCTNEACDARLQLKRRAVLIPDAPKARPDPEPKEKASLKPASLGVGLLAFEDPESSDTEQREQIADDKAAEQDQAGSESDSESPDSESDFDGDEDADESDEQDEYEAEA